MHLQFDESQLVKTTIGLKRLPKEVKEKIIQLYQEGNKVESIAKAYHDRIKVKVIYEVIKEGDE